MPSRVEKWWNDTHVLRAFGIALTNADVLEDGDEFASFLQKPWKWSAEYDIWISNGSPQASDDEGWDEFIDGITEEGADEATESDDTEEEEEEE